MWPTSWYLDLKPELAISEMLCSSENAVKILHMDLRMSFLLLFNLVYEIRAVINIFLQCADRRAENSASTASESCMQNL